MRKYFIFGMLMILLLLIAGCNSGYDDLTPAPDEIDETADLDGNGILDIHETDGDSERDEFLAKETPMSPMKTEYKLREGCYYNKEIMEELKAGITYYTIVFTDNNNIQGYNFTSRSMVTIDKMLDEDVGVCVHEDKWQLFDTEGTAWTMRK